MFQQKPFKGNLDIFKQVLCQELNSSIKLKVDFHARRDQYLKRMIKRIIRSNGLEGNYRPISVLGNLSKVLERFIYNHL